MSISKAVGISTILSSVIVSILFAVFSYVGVTAVGTKDAAIRLSEGVSHLTDAVKETNSKLGLLTGKLNEHDRSLATIKAKIEYLERER